MSALFFNQLKHLQGSYDALKLAYDQLAERVLALESAPPDNVTELDIDTLAEVPKRRGRPPKAKQNE